MEKKAIILGDGSLFDWMFFKKLSSSKKYSDIIILSQELSDIEEMNPHIQIINYSNLHKCWDLIRGDHLYFLTDSTLNPYKRTSEKLKTELENVANVAKIAKHNQVNTVIFKSKSNSKPNALIYENKLKGQIEQTLRGIGFDTLHIVRPYLLLGSSQVVGNQKMIKRMFIKLFNFMMIGFLKNIKGLPYDNFFIAMIHYANKEKKGTFIHSNKEIHALFPKKTKK